MASRRSSGLVLSVLMIILLAFECSSAECDQGSIVFLAYILHLQDSVYLLFLVSQFYFIFIIQEILV